MRIPIAVQLGLLVLLIAVVSIVVLSIATWTTTYGFVVDIESQGLELVAAIKASQIASNLELLEVTCKTISTRLLIQAALLRYYNGNTTTANWATTITDLQSALGTRGFLSTYQAAIFSKNGQNGRTQLVNITSADIPEIDLPYTDSNGNSVKLGNQEGGYPPMLYPNLTYTHQPGDGNSVQVNAFPTFIFDPASALLLGPLVVNSSFSLVSLTLPIVNNTSSTDILGYITVVASGETVQNAVSSRDGLGNTGQVLLLGPSRPENRFAPGAQPATATSAPNSGDLADAQVHYIFEPTPLPGMESRHAGMSTSTPFALSRYPMALDIMRQPYEKENKSISKLSTTNEEGVNVAVGAMRPRSSLVQWVLLVEETHSEAFAAVARLRKIILACVFGTVGLIILMVPLLTHFAVAPIRRLRDAALKTTEPDLGPVRSIEQSEKDRHATGVAAIEDQSEPSGSFWARYFKPPLRRFDSSATITGARRPRAFQIPSRVKERKHLVTDELTELTSTFNEMSDELTIQYNRLEERVAERTRELEKAKLAAEAANESKTLFIANISHELKTPLNGILGMCAVCMGEDDLPRIKKSLQVVYKSGDLLLHLLNDLLTFSKNQIEQAIQLDEKEFKLADIRSQLLVLFQNQVNEKQIDFSVKFVAGRSSQPRGTMCRERSIDHNPPAFGPRDTGRVKNMVLRGDQHRILQVLINLVGNSLKFTPENGKVEVRIRYVEEIDESAALAQDWNPNAVTRSRTSSRASSSVRDAAAPQEDGQPDRPSTSPRRLVFQFEVEDNGPGIPAHLQRRVFDPFVQGDLGLNRKYGGTGLGLSICTQLSQLMGGLILLDSEEGRGSLFTVKIPLQFIRESSPSTHSPSITSSRTPSVLSLEEFARTSSDHGSLRNDEPRVATFENSEMQPRLIGLSQPFFAPGSPASSSRPSQDAQDASEQGKDTKRVRVLVAEDNKVNQEVVLRMLALEDVYDVTVVKDGQEAYDTVRANMEEGKVFDLIFMDIQMPNLDGIQSTKLIRGMGYSAPIVALTAFAEDSNVKDCMESGMDMFISKPIRRPALKQVLSKFATIPEEPSQE